MKTAVIFAIVLLIMVSFLSGCAGITPPSPAELFRHPLGTDPIRLGMTKGKVEDVWGEPDMITYAGTSELGARCEEWVYRARYPGLPINAGYLHKTQYLYFEGNVLVKQKY